jgi:hypothetical protein
MNIDSMSLFVSTRPYHASTLQDPRSRSSRSHRSLEQEQEIIIAPSGAQADFLTERRKCASLPATVPFPCPLSLHQSCENQSQERRANISQPIAQLRSRACTVYQIKSTRARRRLDLNFLILLLTPLTIFFILIKWY